MEDKQNRNIIDMIRDDANNSGTKKNWKTFRDKLRLKRAGRAWTSSVPIPASDIQMPKANRVMIRRGSARYSSSNDEEEEDTGNRDVHESDGEANRHLGDLPDRQRSNRLLPVETDPDPDQDPDQEKEKTEGGDEPISLMALLSTDGSNYEQHEEFENEEDEDEEEHEHEDEIGDYNVCNECKGKHTKGAPVGPCGHMFCKHCTKEMQIGKGNCPACNNFILEILDIY